MVLQWSKRWRQRKKGFAEVVVFEAASHVPEEKKIIFFPPIYSSFKEDEKHFGDSFFQIHSAFGFDENISTSTLPQPARSSPNNISLLTLIFRHVPRLNICKLVELAITAISTVQITSLMLGRGTLCKQSWTKREAALWEVEVYTTCIY